jgi:signal transduction histidine kinase
MTGQDPKARPGGVDERAAPAPLTWVHTELSRTRLLLDLATLPDLELEALEPSVPEAAPGGGAGRRVALEPALGRVARSIQGALGVSTAGLVFLDADGQVVAEGTAGSTADAPRPAPAVLTEILAAGAPLTAYVAAGPDRSAPTAHAEPSADVRDFLARLGAAAVVLAPVVVQDEPRGVLYVASRRPAPFSDEDAAFVVLVAGRIGLLLERAELRRTHRELERQRAQAAARQEFLGIVTHELKTPVAVLRAYTELLLARAEGAGRTEEGELLRRMEDQESRLLAMVDQVLDLQRLDAGLFPLEIGRVDLGALAARVVEGVQLTAGDVRLRVEAGPDVAVRADRRRIEQVLINLLQNAVRFSPPGEAVTVRVGREPKRPDGAGAGAPAPAPSDATSGGSVDGGARVVVSVTDRGPGVAAADRGRIFERFGQGNGGDRPHRGHSGLGAGLYIAREIVARHGGDLWLAPPAPGTPGASFAFALPIAGPDEGD